MTRNEIIEALRPLGVRNMKKMTLAQLQAKYDEMQNAAGRQAECAKEDNAHAQDEGLAIPLLFFDHAFWCEELHDSFYIGYYSAQTWREYNLLLPYSSPLPR